MGFLDVITGVLNMPVHINVAPLYSQRYLNNNAVPFWLLIAAFTITYAIIWLASNNIPIFKTKPGINTRGPRVMFTIAITAIALFGTPLAIWLMWVVYTFTLISIIAITLLGIYVIYTLTKQQWAQNAKTNADSSKVLADAKTQNAASDRQNAKTKEYQNKTKEAVRKGMHYQLREIRKLQHELGGVVTQLMRIKNRNVYPPNRHQVNRIASDLVQIRQNLGNIITYVTNNDRIMSTMSTAHYSENNTTTMTQLDPAGSGRSSIHPAIESQTNDLGHTISAMTETLQVAGLQNVTTVNRMLHWGDAAINIAKRMEREIVLEEQMIEKI